jgi:hypothetical protein
MRPAFEFSVEFYIMVTAGAKYDPETRIFSANPVIATQKFPEKQAMPVRGTASIFPIIISLAFDIYDLFSNLSEIIPPNSADPNPKIVKLSALIRAYYDLNSGKFL